MTARPFSRIEPASNPDDPARAIATLFAVVSGIGAWPGIYGGLMLTLMLFTSLSEAKPVALGFLAMVLYVMLGFLQMLFYFRRTLRETRGARAWWVSTYFYNLVPVGLSIAGFVNDPHAGWIISTLWFATLSTLAIVAYGAERRDSMTAVIPRGRAGLVRRGRSL